MTINCAPLPASDHRVNHLPTAHSLTSECTASCKKIFRARHIKESRKDTTLAVLTLRSLVGAGAGSAPVGRMNIAVLKS